MAKSKTTAVPALDFTDIPSALPWQDPPSLFWRELAKDKSPDAEHLRIAVRAVVEGALGLSTQVVRHMPLYTDHGARHLRNVLHIMESLVTAEGIRVLQPIGCALCIVAAYIHDLGMVLTGEEAAELAAVRAKREPTSDFGQKYRAHEDAQPALRRERDRLRGAGQVAAADLIDAHLLAEFLRQRHARPGGAIARELGFILTHAKLTDGILYAGRDWQHDAVAIAASHGEKAHWLRGTHLGGRAERVWANCPGLKKTNLVLPGLLLRLADIIDLDRSRTPGILFYHLGLGELGAPELARLSGKDVSAREWQKHLAIDEYGFAPLGSDYVVRYVSQACPHPAVEQSLREFVRWIDHECDAVARELRQLRREEDPFTPLSDALRPLVRADLDLKPTVQKDGRPAYVYDPEFQFRLDQDQVMRLLMGANLYGDPAICIRELLQNSLDALELRDARLKRRRHDKKAGEPVDELAAGETLRVELSWGEDPAGRRFIRVRDWGTGMTRAQIRRYFATVGRSYYTSPEFEAERAALTREQAARVSPISQFGIGILSCFMVAERLTVLTHPGGDGAGREPSCFEVTGPGRLFVLRDGGLATQGTEIILWLRDHIKFEPWTAGQALVHVRRALDHKLTEAEESLLEIDKPYEDRRETMADLEGQVERRLHPAYEAMRHVLWPLYPVALRGPRAGETWEIDPGIALHFGRLCPINRAALAEEARKWLHRDVPSQVEWTHWDWTDPETGSRVRLVVPVDAGAGRTGLAGLHEQAGDHCSPSLLAAWCEPQLESQGRTRYLARGVAVANVDALVDDFVLGSGLGTWSWVDLRGELAPGVTTARDRALPPADVRAWSEGITRLGARYLTNLSRILPPGAEANVRLALRWHRRRLTLRAPEPQAANILSLFSPSELEKGNARSRRALLNARLLRVEFAHTQALAHHHRDRALLRDPNLGPNGSVADSVSGDQRSDFYHAGYRASFRSAARCDLDLDLAPSRDHARARFRGIAPGSWRLLAPAIWLSEGLFPSLAEAFPPFAMWGEAGQAWERWPLGPVLFPRVGLGQAPREPLLRDMDFVFPLSVTPLGALREKVQATNYALANNWRNWHSVLTLPFLLPDAELAREWSELVQDAAALGGLGGLSAFLPRLGLWETPFAEWRADDFPKAGYTARWDFASGTVKWCLGLVSAAEVAAHGREFAAFLELDAVKTYHTWLRTLPEEQEAERDLAEWEKQNGKDDDFL